MAVIAAGALLASGCGSGDDKDGKSDGGGGKPEAGASASESASPSEETPEQPSGDASGDAGGEAPDGESGESGKLSGVWKAKGKQYVLTVVGDSVTLLRERGRNCTGRAGGASGRTLALKCPGGGEEDRTNGTVGALKDKSLTVSWQGGPTEVYTRVTDVPVKLPESPEN